MAQLEGASVFESIEQTQRAETAAHQARLSALRARGKCLLDEHTRLEERLRGLKFDPTRHLNEVANGRIDLVWAVALTVLNGALAIFALALSNGPLWTTLLLSLLILVSAAPVEEFFVAHHDESPLREGLFLVLAALAVGASFWIGTLRGAFVVSEHTVGVGPVSDMLRAVGQVLRYALGILSIVSEILCGWKWARVRQCLGSATARAVKRRDTLANQMIALHLRIKTAEIEPIIRRDYRTIGARQYLAHAAEDEPNRDHLRRAIIGAFIGLAIIVGLLFVARAAGAAEATPTIRVALLDLTRSSALQDLRANATAIGTIIQALPLNSRLIVIGIADSVNHVDVLFDRTIATRASFGLELAAARETAAADWTRVAADLRPKYTKTNLVGAISLLPYFVVGGHYDLLILSDGRENVSADLGKASQIGPLRIVQALRREHAVPPLPGVRVQMLGVTPTGKSAAYLNSLKEFWAAYFVEAGARLEAFRIDRTVTF